MTTVPSAVLTMVVLAVAGALPVLALVGGRWQALPLAPLGGAVIAAVAGACCLATAGSALSWFVVLAPSAAAVTIAWWLLGRRRRRPVPDGTPPSPAGSDGPLLPARRVTVGAGAAVVAAAVAWSLMPLRVPSTGWDARAIWLMRASWFAAGHQTVLAAFRNPQLSLAHASYPPLISATVAVAWQLTGNHGDRLGVVVIALLNGCAVAAASWVLVEAGRVVAARDPDRPRRAVTPLVVGVVAAGLFVLAAFGVFGPFATNGYADPLWSATAVGAIGYGLLLPGGRANLASAGILLAVSGLTKVEGTATAAVIVGLLVARAVIAARSARRTGGLATVRAVARRPGLAGLAGLAALAVWPVLTRLEGTTPNVSALGQRRGDVAYRARLTVDAMAPHLHVLLLAAPLALVAGWALAHNRRRAGLGNDLWAWVALAAGLLVVGLAYVTGSGDTAYWLLTSVHRTTMFPAVAAWLIVAGWAIVAAGGRPRPAGRPGR